MFWLHFTIATVKWSLFYLTISTPHSLNPHYRHRPPKRKRLSSIMLTV